MPMYRSSIRSLNERAPAADAISGVASQYGDPLEQAAYLRGRMRAQEFLQQKQITEANQNRLLAAQEESERRNAAREAMAEQRFTQAQKDAAARASFQEDQQARILDQQQWERKFNMEKATAAEERYRKEAEAEAAKLAKAEEIRIAKEQRDEQEKASIGEVTGAMLGAGMDVDSQTAKYLAYSYARANPEQRSGILKYIQDTAAYNEQKKKDETALRELAGVDFSKTRPEGLVRDAVVYVDKDPSEGITPSLVKKSELLKNQAWKEITTDAGGGYLIGGKPAVANLPQPKWGGLGAAEAAPVVPQTSPMAPPAVAPTAAPVATPAAETPRTFNSIEEADAANLPSGTPIIVNGRRAIVE
jgi:hypothetical protein